MKKILAMLILFCFSISFAGETQNEKPDWYNEKTMQVITKVGLGNTQNQESDWYSNAQSVNEVTNKINTSQITPVEQPADSEANEISKAPHHPGPHHPHPGPHHPHPGPYYPHPGPYYPHPGPYYPPNPWPNPYPSHDRVVCKAYDTGWEEHWGGHGGGPNEMEACQECLRKHGSCRYDCSIQILTYKCTSEFRPYNSSGFSNTYYGDSNRDRRTAEESAINVCMRNNWGNQNNGYCTIKDCDYNNQSQTIRSGRCRK